MTDPLEQRLRSADPARPGANVPTDPRIRELMEATMSTDETRTETSTPQSPRRRGRWTVGLVVAAAAATVAVGSAVVLEAGEDAPPAAVPTSLSLSLPPQDAMSSCLQYSTDVLSQMPTAFSGEVVSVNGPTVVLDVDRWYRGGDADRVELAGADADPALVGGVRFAEGVRYLVTADGSGTVNACGYSAEWDESMAGDFETAFAD